MLFSRIVFLMALFVSDVNMQLHAYVGAGRCLWEKTSNGCQDPNERLEFDAYDFYSVCRPGNECKTQPAKIDADTCKITGEDMPEEGEDEMTNTEYCTECEESMCANVV